MTSKKHSDFVGEPMRGKPVTAVPGIGPVLAERLKNKGVSQAGKLYGHFLVHDQNPEAFKSYLAQKVSANSKQASASYNAFNEWSQHHF